MLPSKLIPHFTTNYRVSTARRWERSAAALLSRPMWNSPLNYSSRRPHEKSASIVLQIFNLFRIKKGEIEMQMSRRSRSESVDCAVETRSPMTLFGRWWATWHISPVPRQTIDWDEVSGQTEVASAEEFHFRVKKKAHTVVAGRRRWPMPTGELRNSH